MTEPPPNHRLGQARSRLVRSSAAAQQRKKAWEAISRIAIMDEVTTLQDFADRLNEQEVPTSRGGPWTPQLVQRIMAAKGVSAKELTKRVTQPSVFEPRRDWPPDAYKEFRRRLDQIDAPSERTGQWLPATRHAPKVADLVRQPSRGQAKFPVGQVIAVKSISTFICRFTADELGSSDHECAAAELEVFRYYRSREERIEETQKWRDYLFRRNSRRDD